MDITDETFIQAVRDLVTENPGYAYSAPDHMKEEHEETDLTCFYVHVDEEEENPSPGCLIGQALHRLGISLETLQEHEGRGAREVLFLLELPLSEKARAFAQNAQNYQDDGEFWSEALKQAEQMLTEGD